NLTNEKYTVDKIHINVENVIMKNFKIINRPKLKSTCVFSFDNFEVENKMEVESKILLYKIYKTKLPLRTSFDGSRFELDNNMNFSNMRKIMNSVDNVLEEQRFCKLELRSKRELKDTPWFEKQINFVYEHLFDYGHSIVKPFICLLSIWFVFSITEDKYVIILNLGDSFIRTLPLCILNSNKLDVYTQWHHVLQSSVSTIFWFFLLLAIRNNFKIRW
ncbi:MAG: hypothetical protein P8N25_03075, partial [Alphaproteobacteria bacterium]|nr:hypothetical protein [Alphaproteobacteria bacterium]